MASISQRHKVQPKKFQGEQLQHRGCCRGPAQWANYSDLELNEMHEKARQLREGGYETDQQYLLWLYKQK